MRRLGSLVIEAADAVPVPAGRALAVDRAAFARHVTERIESEPGIEVRRERLDRIPDAPLVILATGPLTAEPLAGELGRPGRPRLPLLLRCDRPDRLRRLDRPRGRLPGLALGGRRGRLPEPPARSRGLRGASSTRCSPPTRSPLHPCEAEALLRGLPADRGDGAPRPRHAGLRPAEAGRPARPARRGAPPRRRAAPPRGQARRPLQPGRLPDPAPRRRAAAHLPRRSRGCGTRSSPATARCTATPT